MNMKKGQGAFEYILMLSGVLLIVILIIFILQSTLSGANNSVQTQQGTVQRATNVSIVQLIPGRYLNLTVYESTGNVNSTTFPCCTWYGPLLVPAGGYATACGVGVTANCTASAQMNGNWNAITCVSRNFDIINGRCT
jgi:hypothetical protein